MPKPIVAALALLAFCSGLARGRSYDREILDLEQALETGDWNQRIRAVKNLSALGSPALQVLRKALKDPDWQVRWTAAHGLGRMGPSASRAIQEAVVLEPCPLVRMSLAHWLGTLGLKPAQKSNVTPNMPSPEMNECQAWPWPPKGSISLGQKRLSHTAENTPSDPSGCQYVHYRHVGRIPCPEGTVVQGIGPAPGAIEFLAGKAPPSGVALCCPGTLAARAGPPATQDVECRLVPIECPPSWVEMENPKKRALEEERSLFTRTRQMRDGSLAWVHCCPPPPSASTPKEPPSQDTSPGAPAAVTVAAHPVAERPNVKPFSPKRVSPEERIGELNPILAYSPEDLPRPSRIPEHEEAEYTPTTPPLPTRGQGKPELAARSKDLGDRNALKSPKTASPRGDAGVQAAPQVMPDGGTRLSHDPLPGLLEMLHNRNALKRARAAEAIANLGKAGAPALEALKAAIKDKSPRVRSSAALALGSVTRGSDAALPELKRALKDRHIDVRYSAAEALGRIGTPEALKVFNRQMGREARRFIRDAAGGAN